MKIFCAILSILGILITFAGMVIASESKKKTKGLVIMIIGGSIAFVLPTYALFNGYSIVSILKLAVATECLIFALGFGVCVFGKSR